jgi:TctA family transporter
MSKPAAQPSLWTGATWTSAVVIAILAGLCAVLFLAALATHADAWTLKLTGAGAVLFAVLALAQHKALRQERQDRL